MTDLFCQESFVTISKKLWRFGVAMAAIYSGPYHRGHPPKSHELYAAFAQKCVRTEETAKDEITVEIC